METTNINLEIDPQDLEKYKTMAIIAYIIFLIPLLAAKDSKYAMYHTNQGLILFLLAVIINVVGSIVPIIGWFIIIPIGNLLVLILAILGIVNAVQGNIKPLPIIGKYKLIK